MAHPQLYRITGNDYTSGQMEVLYKFGYGPGYQYAERMAGRLYALGHVGTVTMELYHHNQWRVTSKRRIEKEESSCAE